jgi:hypothetical protein
VPEQQLHLFDPARPLLERFGEAFFKAVPARPGVYIMSGEGERVLYIGQSGNLRHRLGSYKNARPDRAPRKVVRLIHAVRSLVWEVCDNVESARLKETQLLRVHRPKFNVLNTYPHAHRFISVMPEGESLHLTLAAEPVPGAKTYGAFKAGSVQAFGALLRLFWAALHQPQNPHDFPRQLLHARPPGNFALHLSLPQHLNLNLNLSLPSSTCPVSPANVPTSEHVTSCLYALLAGESADLIAILTTALQQGLENQVFQRNLLAADLETLSGFYDYSAKRNRELRQRHGLPGTIIPKETLDDLLALKMSTCIESNRRR